MGLISLFIVLFSIGIVFYLFDEKYRKSKDRPNENKCVGNYGGLINYYNLQDFWHDLSNEERNKIKNWANQGFSTDSGFREIDSGDTSSSQSASLFLSSLATFAVQEKQYILAEKMLMTSIDFMESAIDLHYSYHQLINLLYKQRNTNSSFLERCVDVCKKDVQLYPEFCKEYIEEKRNNDKKFNSSINNTEYVCDVSFPSFERLAIIYEKNKEYSKALDLYEKAEVMGYFQLVERKQKLISKMTKLKML